MPAAAVALQDYQAWLTEKIDSATFTPFAARTQQYVKEQLGQANEKVGEPGDARNPRLTSVVDSTSAGLPRTREEGRCSQASSPEASRSHVCITLPQFLLFKH